MLRRSAIATPCSSSPMPSPPNSFRAVPIVINRLASRPSSPSSLTASSPSPPRVAVGTKLERARRILLHLGEGEELLGSLGCADQRVDRRVDELRSVSAGGTDELERRRVVVRTELGKILASVADKGFDP